MNSRLKLSLICCRNNLGKNILIVLIFLMVILFILNVLCLRLLIMIDINCKSNY